jgi:TPR repeat protein
MAAPVASAASAQPPKKRRRHWWLWLLVGTFGVFAVAIALLVGLFFLAGGWRSLIDDETQACDHGEALSCAKLGGHYEEGLGVPIGRRRSTASPAILAARASCSDLADLYRSDEDHPKDGIKADDALAATLHRKACEGGYASACRLLATQYDDGEGVPKDEVQAGALYRRGCDGGDSFGCALASLNSDESKGATSERRRLEVEARSGSRKRADGETNPPAGVPAASPPTTQH